MVCVYICNGDNDRRYKWNTASFGKREPFHDGQGKPIDVIVRNPTATCPLFQIIFSADLNGNGFKRRFDEFKSVYGSADKLAEPEYLTAKDTLLEGIKDVVKSCCDGIENIDDEYIVAFVHFGGESYNEYNQRIGKFCNRSDSKFFCYAISKGGGKGSVNPSILTGTQQRLTPPIDRSGIIKLLDELNASQGVSVDLVKRMILTLKFSDEQESVFNDKREQGIPTSDDSGKGNASDKSPKEIPSVGRVLDVDWIDKEIDCFKKQRCGCGVLCVFGISVVLLAGFLMWLYFRFLPLSPCLIWGGTCSLFVVWFSLVWLLMRFYGMCCKKRMYFVRMRAFMEFAKVIDTCEDEASKSDCRTRLIGVLSEVLNEKT